MPVCAVCAMIRVRVCRCVRVCVFVCWNLTFQPLGSFCVSCRLYHTVPQALYFAAHTVQQQSHSKVVWNTTYYACVDIAYACVLCMLWYVCVRVAVCRSVLLRVWCRNPTCISALDFLFALRYCCCHIMSASHRASSSQALYYVAATVQQKTVAPRFAWTTSMRLLTLHTCMRLCDGCVLWHVNQLACATIILLLL